MSLCERNSSTEHGLAMSSAEAAVIAAAAAVEARDRRTERNATGTPNGVANYATVVCGGVTPLAGHSLPVNSDPLGFSNIPKVLIETPDRTLDFDVTPDGRVLLASAELGLKEYSSVGGELLSRWPSPLWRCDVSCSSREPAVSGGRYEPDEARSVAALDERHVAVGLCFSGQVIVLRRNSLAASGNIVGQSTSVWLAVGCIKLPDGSSVRHIAAFGDRLGIATGAFTACRCFTCRYLAAPRHELLVVTLAGSGDREIGSSGAISISVAYEPLSVELTSQGAILSTGNILTTASADLPGNSHVGGSQHASYVLDAFSSQPPNQRLWRHVAGRGELLIDATAAHNGRLVYALMIQPYGGHSRVTVLDAESGRVLRLAAMSSWTVESSLRSPLRLKVVVAQQITPQPLETAAAGLLEYKRSHFGLAVLGIDPFEATGDVAARRWRVSLVEANA